MNYIPYSRPYIPKSTYPALESVLDSGWLTTGPNVKCFEDQFGQKIGSRYCVAVSSCTAALHLSYLAHGIKTGDEVLVPSFTFCSTVNALIHVGATPVFCDIDDKTLCIDPKDIERKISNKTKATVIVHYGGMPCDLDAINRLANKYNLLVIEDAAHAFRTKYKGKYVGSSKNTTCFSFYATKNITTGEGGMITTNSKEIFNFLQIMRMHGISKNAWRRYHKGGDWMYEVIAPGYKYNMSDINAVIGIEQLNASDYIEKKRQEHVDLYRQLLSENHCITAPLDPPYENSQHSWHLFTIRINPLSKVSRDELIKKMQYRGIGTSVHFIPNHLQKYYKDNYGDVHLPATEDVYKTIISLPLYVGLKRSEIKYICDTIYHLTN